MELVGVPGSGKTTLLRALRRQQRVSLRLSVLLSDRRRLSPEHFGVLWLLKDYVRSGRDFMPFTGLKRVFYDTWHAGTLDSYPEIFERVLECLQKVPIRSRQRSVLLNYWQARVRLFSEHERRGPGALTIVDEGLCQATFSTMRRMTVDELGIRTLAGSLLDSLPKNRILVFLETPADIVGRRSDYVGGEGKQRLDEYQEHLEFLVGHQRQASLPTYKIDGSQGMVEKLSQLSAILRASI